MQNLTPAMQQYMDIKNRHPDCLVLFRMGDFYETFFEDAKTASEVLEITLTSRGNKNGAKIPLAGIPYHALDTYLAKFIKKNIKVAIVEQLEDPRFAKGVVKRGVVRIITPGTVTEPLILDEKTNNYLACIYPKKSFGISFVDLSTGEFLTTETTELMTEIMKNRPAELILPESFEGSKLWHDLEAQGFCLNSLEDRFFLESWATEELKRHFSVHSLDGFGITKLSASSSGALLWYLKETQKSALKHIKSLKYLRNSDCMIIDNITAQNLELVRSITKGTAENTLLKVIDKTRTAMGARLLKKWLLSPLFNLKEINKRLDSVEELAGNSILQEDLVLMLRGVTDLERLVSKISLGTANPRDLVSLRTGLLQVPKLKEILKNTSKEILTAFASIAEPTKLCHLLKHAIMDETPINPKEGGVINRGLDKKLDDLHDIVKNGKTIICDMETEERKATGIKSLKIGYNRVFGYFFEVTKKNLTLVPDYYIRKQTMTNCERFATIELKEWEEKILTAEDKINRMEYDLFCDICRQVEEKISDIQNIAEKIGQLDCLCSFAIAANENIYCRPKFCDDKIELKASRHPMIEKIEESFIPNNILLADEQKLMIITGPNMAGKSTVMRQVAICCIMAQMGSFVPADFAKISLTGRIFSRVGAHDDITHGQSTFMVEMSEVAQILNHAKKDSLIIMDEIGRGTSTFDGVAIAWAVAEHIAMNVRCNTMFATHYHVLTKLDIIKGVQNFNIAVKEKGGQILFERKLIPGSTDKSYGIHVAGLAGMPGSVIRKASEVQKDLERDDNMQKQLDPDKRSPKQTSLDNFEIF